MVYSARMGELARTGVRALLVFPALVAALGLVGAFVNALEIAGSPLTAGLAFTVMPWVVWRGWRGAVVSIAFTRSLTRAALALGLLSVVLGLIGAGWPAFVAVLTLTPAAEVSFVPWLEECAGVGVCASALTFGVVAAAELWRQPAPASSVSERNTSDDASSAG